ncbi:MAG: hypothetical protein J2P24_02235, partial [Streptosporangiales bacterium]|nr:hypothetical protein [Streptosporangiales bacterium]
MRSVVRALVGVVALAVLGGGVAACGPVQMGAAAIVGDERITVASVNGPARDVHRLAPVVEQQGGNVPAGIVLARVVNILVTRLAKEEGVGWTQGDVDAAIAKATQGQGLQPNQVYTVPLFGNARAELPTEEAKAYGRALYLAGALEQRFGGADELAKRLTSLARRV